MSKRLFYSPLRIVRGIKRRLRPRTRLWKARLATLGSSEARRRRTLDRILATRPLATDVPGMREGEWNPLEVHVLCCWGDYVQAIWAVKSFYHYSCARFPLVIHLQGYAPPDVMPRLVCHFPTARIIAQAEADAIVEPWLRARGFNRLLEMRRSLAPMLKLTDFFVLSRANNVISFDSDVLFFQPPTELLVADGAPLPYRLFLRDQFNSYTIAPEDAFRAFGIRLAPRLNAGLMAFARQSIHLAACEQYMNHPRLGQKHWHLDQTLHALDACASGEVRYLPERYLLADDPQAHPEELAARHYTSPIRPLLTTEGVAHLVRCGFLQQWTQHRQP